MDYRKLGSSGAVVSKFCLGTMTFGAETNEATSHEILDDYVAAGGNFIDTVDVYSAGVSEEIIGRWLAARPTESRQMVVATKGRFPMGPGPNDIGISRRHLTHALEDSLTRLGIDQIDLRAGPGCLNRFSASISGASTGVMPPGGLAAG